ncbi:MAG: hypothetical protein ACOWW1_04540 [archaeon]
MVEPLFYDGFETADFSGWTTTSGAPTIDSNVHHGSYGLKCSTSDDVSKTFGSSYNEIYLRTYFKHVGNSGWHKIVVFHNTTNGVIANLLYDTSSNTFRLWYLNGGSLTNTNVAFTLSANTWYSIELGVTIDGSSGEYSLWVDDEKIIDLSGLDNDLNGEVNQVCVGNSENSNECYFDCVAVADSYINAEIETTNVTFNDEILLPCADPVQLSNIEMTDAIFGWTVAFVQGAANAAQKYVTVNDSSLFTVGKKIAIHDDDSINDEDFEMEMPIIVGKDDEINQLELNANLARTYTETANAVVDQWSPNGFTLPKNLLRLGDEPNENNSSVFLVRDSYSTAPLFTTNQGMVVQKDLTAGGFLGTNQGEVWIGHGRHYASDPPTIMLMHSGSEIRANATGSFVPLMSTYGFYVGDVVTVKDLEGSETKIVSALQNAGNPGVFITTPLSRPYSEEGAVYNYDTLHIERLDGTLGNMKLGTLISTQLGIPAQHEVFSVIAADNGPDTDAYLVPQNPSPTTGLGLGTANVPFKWVDAEHLFADTLNGLTDVDLNITPNAGRKVVINGDLQVTGGISTGTQKGSNTTDANGDSTVNFGESFGSTPLVFVQSRDSTGRGVRFDVTSKSTTSFTVKATVLPANHKHKIGQALATVNWTMGIDNATGAHKHGFDGFAAVDLAHSHGNHQHGFGSGAEQAAVDLAHSHGTHQHGFGAGNEAAAVDLGHSHGSHSHGFSDYAGTTSSGSHSHPSAGSHSHSMSGTGVQTGTTSGHSHLYYVVSGWSTSASGSHSHSSAGSHSHSVSVSGTTGSSTVSLGSTVSYVGGNTAFTTVSLGQTLSTVGGNTAFTGISIGETLAYVGGYTKEDAAHGHDLSNKAPYARSIQLRDENGAVVEAGGTMTTVSDALTQLYTEAADLSGESKIVDFDWMAIPA